MPFKNGTIVPNATVWTDEMISYLKKNFFKKSNRELAHGLGLRLRVTRTKCYQLGLKKMEMEYWTDEQVIFLKENYKNIGDKELAIIFNKKYKKNKGWTHKHIDKKRKYLNLKRTADEIKKIRSRNIKRDCFKSRSTWKTRGVTADGTIKIWAGKSYKNAYKVIKFNGKFVHYAQWLYIKNFGAFPAKHIVGFKDGDNMNVVPENLEAITRSEHARRNRTLNLPDEIIAFKKLVTALSNIINQKQNERKNTN